MLYIFVGHALIVGKPNQFPPKAPLKPILAFDEPFFRIIIDCVGPLPKAKCGNEYMWTIMCPSTRFPEAIPLSTIKDTIIVKALTKCVGYKAVHFFSLSSWKSRGR